MNGLYCVGPTPFNCAADEPDRVRQGAGTMSEGGSGTALQRALSAPRPGNSVNWIVDR